MKSPCIHICQIDKASGLCTGCLRSLEEIASWSKFTGKKRKRILAELPRRRIEASGTDAD